MYTTYKATGEARDQVTPWSCPCPHRLSWHSMVCKFLTSSPPSSSYTLVRCVYCSRNPHAVHICSLASSDMETGLWSGAHNDVGASVLFTTWGHRLCEEYTRADDETGIRPRSLTDKASPSAPLAKPNPTYDLNLPPRLTLETNWLVNIICAYVTRDNF